MIYKLVAVANYMIETNGQVPFARSVAKRVSMYASCALVCSPCVMWSAVCRAIACPFMCFCKGPFYACSDNGCTSLSDNCVSAFCTRITEPVSFPPMSVPTTASDIEATLALVNKLEQLYTVVRFDTVHYKICEVVIRPLTGQPTLVPYNVKHALAILRENIRDTVKA